MDGKEYYLLRGGVLPPNTAGARKRETLDALRALRNVRELLIPVDYNDESICRMLFEQRKYVSLVDTLHLETCRFSVGDVIANPLDNEVRVLSLIRFTRITTHQLKRILLAFPKLQQISFRFCRPKDNYEKIKQEIMGDVAFQDRQEGWFDRIVFDEAVLSITLYRYDEQKGRIVPSDWTLLDSFYAFTRGDKNWKVEDGELNYIGKNRKVI